MSSDDELDFLNEMADMRAPLSTVIDLSELECHVLEMRHDEVNETVQKVSNIGENELLESNSIEWKNLQVNVVTLSKQLVFGKYIDCLKNNDFFGVFKSIGNSVINDDSAMYTRFFEHCENSVYDYVTDGGDDELSELFRGAKVMFTGAALLQMYVQSNWTGPPLEDADVAEACYPVNMEKESVDKIALNILQYQSKDISEVCQLVSHPYLLALASAILLPLSDKKMSVGVQKLFSSCVWVARAIRTWQSTMLFEEPSKYLSDITISNYKKALLHYPKVRDVSKLYLHARLLLEFGVCYTILNKHDEAREYCEQAKIASRMQVLLTGGVAKRTKFQKSGYASMLLKAQSLADEAGVPDSIVKVQDNNTHSRDTDDQRKHSTTTSTVAASSDVIVDDNANASDPKEAVDNFDISTMGTKKIRLKDADPFTHLLESRSFDLEHDGQEKLCRIDQSILLGFCTDLRKNRPKDSLTLEEVSAYIERVQLHPRNWMIHSTSLLLQCWCESESHLRAERAVLQLNALVDQHTNELTPLQSSTSEIEKNSAPNYERLQYIYCLCFPPRWELKASLGRRLVKLGVLRSAVEIFTSLQMWNEVVDCFTVMEERKKGIALIEERLKVKESPRLLVALGDLTGVVTHYSKAWNVSKERYWPAMQRLGRVSFVQKKYDESITYLKKAAGINANIVSVWFLMGSAAMRNGNDSLDVARNAFSKVISIEPDNGKAWGNLSAILIRLGRIKEAYKATMEAIKHEPRNWRMWDNMLTLSLAVDDYSYAIVCYNKLLDISSDDFKFSETTLSSLVDGIVKEYENQNQMQDQLNQTSTDIADNNDHETEFTMKVDQKQQLLIKQAKDSQLNHLISQMEALFTRITSKVSNSPVVWDLFSKFYLKVSSFMSHISVKDSIVKATECKLKQNRAMKVAGWESDVSKFNQLAEAAIELVELYKLDDCKDSLYSNGAAWVKSIVKRTQLDLSHLPLHQKLSSILQSLESN